MDKRRSSAEIEKEFQAERATIKKLQAQLEAAKAEAKKAEAEQDRAAYKALAHDDKGAQQRLEEAENALAKAARRVVSYEKAIGQAMEKFNALEAAWRGALNLEALEKLKALARERIKLAPRLDAALAEVVAVNAEFERLSRDMLVIKQSLGIRTKLHEGNLRERIRAALYPTFGEFRVSKTFGYIRERDSMRQLESDCFELLLAMNDLPESGGPEPEADGDRQDAEQVEQAEAGGAA